jgi:hypothetical protein
MTDGAALKLGSPDLFRKMKKFSLHKILFASGQIFFGSTHNIKSNDYRQHSMHHFGRRCSTVCTKSIQRTTGTNKQLWKK